MRANSWFLIIRNIKFHGIYDIKTQADFILPSILTELFRRLYFMEEFKEMLCFQKRLF